MELFQAGLAAVPLAAAVVDTLMGIIFVIRWFSSITRNVNFISGRNGSGKSAILAALQICLGANAHSTHRARKLSDFIRYCARWIKAIHS